MGEPLGLKKFMPILVNICNWEGKSNFNQKLNYLMKVYLCQHEIII